MKKIKLVLVIGAVLFSLALLLVGGYYAYWYVKSWRGESELAKLTMTDQGQGQAVPEELSTAFDPADNAGIYNVIEVDKSNGRLTLAYEWPRTMGGRQISSVLTCKGLDYQIYTADSKVPRYVTKETMLTTIDTTPKDQMVLSGYCSDSKCSEINRGCQLRIIREKYVAK